MGIYTLWKPCAPRMVKWGIAAKSHIFVTPN